MAETLCTACKDEVTFSSSRKCNQCEYIFCINCSNYHNFAANSFYPESSDQQAVCGLHFFENGYFCENEDCIKAICRSCTEFDHSSHQHCGIATRAQQNLEDVTYRNLELRGKLGEINDFISKFNNWKNNFDEEIENTKSAILDKYNSLSDMVNNACNEQMKKLDEKKAKLMRETSDELETLVALQDKIIDLIQKNRHFPTYVSNLNIVTNFLFYKSNNHDIKYRMPSFMHISLVDCKTIPDMLLEQHIKDYMGKFTTVVNQMTFYDGSHKVNEIGFVCQSTDIIKDICYDSQRNYLYVLVYIDIQFLLKVFSEGNCIQSVSLNNIPDARLISLLPNHAILLLSESKLTFVNDLLNKIVHLPPKLSELENVATICSSPCKNFVYIYCKDSYIFKYNFVADKVEDKFIYLPHKPDWMDVEETLEKLAFTGFEMKNIHICSYSTGNALLTIENLACDYRHTLFLQNNDIIAFNHGNRILEFFKYPEKQSFRNIATINYRSENKMFENVRAIAKFSPNEILICEMKEIYKIAI